MKAIYPLILTALAATAASDYPVKPVPFTAVHVTDQFWAPKIETNRKVTIPFAFRKDEETGRLDNFIRAAHALLRRGEFELGAEQQQHLAPFDRHAFRHDEDQLVALGGGDDACPYNSLYWDFIARNASRFSNNPRMSLPLRNWASRDEATKAAIRSRAGELREKLRTGGRF